MRKTLSDFYSALAQDRELTMRFLAAVEGKHSGEAIAAICEFAASLGFDVTPRDIAADRLPGRD